MHELEFIYVFEHLNDICVLFYISYIITGMSPREAIEKISGTECPTLPNNDLGSLKECFQPVIGDYMEENYSVIP